MFDLAILLCFCAHEGAVGHLLNIAGIGRLHILRHNVRIQFSRGEHAVLQGSVQRFAAEGAFFRTFRSMKIPFARVSPRIMFSKTVMASTSIKMLMNHADAQSDCLSR